MQAVSQQRLSLAAAQRSPLDLAQEFYRRHQPIEVADTLLDDLVFLYASEALEGDDCEAFIERVTEEDHMAAVRLDFCHCCMAVNAALYLDDQSVYEAFLPLLDLDDEDEMLADMKRFILRKLGADHEELARDEGVFRARVQIALSKI
ncbi:hypothetical protein QE400_000031 [Xanthomonas sacchari]|uniref:hypothetical protein n=1 Tax=Xanthomonas sacchari TaxID=56458 RepID=UPI002788C7C8|nr:hypothetical protein [Xanthomonas sacchari]MDQ1090618.1 hypothetical protein [Xanthomonas sacchari]